MPLSLRSSSYSCGATKYPARVPLLETGTASRCGAGVVGGAYPGCAAAYAANAGVARRAGRWFPSLVVNHAERPFGLRVDEMQLLTGRTFDRFVGLAIVRGPIVRDPTLNPKARVWT